MSRNPKSAPGNAGCTFVDQSVEQPIASLDGLRIVKLREFWLRRFQSTPPPIQSADILRRLIAWKIQVEAFGDLDPQTKRQLQSVAQAVAKGRPITAPPVSRLQPGTILVREWRGIERRVLVLDNGFEHEGKRYATLSKVACAITGTHWSGPRFFGLTNSSTNSPKPKQGPSS